MNKIFLLISALFVSIPSRAGIETTLFHQQVDQCMIHITHDATPDATTGTLVLRVYKLNNGVHDNCFSDKDSINNSIDMALKSYQSNDKLKPITSLFIGRIIHYPWINEHLNNSLYQLNPANKQNEINKLVLQSEISSAFTTAIEQNNLKVTGASCEKILLDKNNILTDAMCWLIVNN